jgi:hypothetical protein
MPVWQVPSEHVVRFRAGYPHYPHIPHTTPLREQARFACIDRALARRINFDARNGRDYALDLMGEHLPNRTEFACSSHLELVTSVSHEPSPRQGRWFVEAAHLTIASWHDWVGGFHISTCPPASDFALSNAITDSLCKCTQAAAARPAKFARTLENVSNPS